MYNKLIADGATGVIHTKAKDICCACITNWDAFKAAERKARIFIIDVFEEAWYFELCEPVTLYADA